MFVEKERARDGEFAMKFGRSKKKDEWHDNIITYIRDQLKLKESPKFKICYTASHRAIHYEPDIALRKGRELVMIEVESSRTGKVFEDLLCPFLIENEVVNRLVIVFSNKDGRGRNRVEATKALEQKLRHYIPNLPKIDILWIENESDRKLNELLRSIACA